MSLPDDDLAVLEAIGGSAEDISVNGEDAAIDTEYVTREEFESLRDTVRELVRMINTQSDGSGRHLTTLHKYAQMYVNGDREPLSASDIRAVEIHRNWDSIAHQLPNGYTGVSTRKKSTKENGPGKLRVDLQHILGQDLQRVQIYRAMKRTASLSGGNAEPDEYGRLHITGGLYEYHERTTPDNTDSQTYKVLVQP